MSEKLWSVPILSWAFYDFANTIFSLNIVSLYFALWISTDLQGGEYLYPPTFALSMLAVALVAPFLGHLADRQGQKPFLLAFTATCVTATALLAWTRQAGAALIMFALANFSYQVSLVFYNALLPAVSRDRAGPRIAARGRMRSRSAGSGAYAARCSSRSWYSAGNILSGSCTPTSGTTTRTAVTWDSRETRPSGGP